MINSKAITTQEYFNMNMDQLLEINNEYDYTKEECKIFDEGLEVIFLDDEQELEKEKEEINTYILNKGFEVKAKLLTINERIALILN
jgi:hypothetical protein